MYNVNNNNNLNVQLRRLSKGKVYISVSKCFWISFW